MVSSAMRQHQKNFNGDTLAHLNGQDRIRDNSTTEFSYHVNECQSKTRVPLTELEELNLNSSHEYVKIEDRKWRWNKSCAHRSKLRYFL